MGCGASVDKPADATQMELICAAMTKEMMYLCFRRALAKSESISVKAPKDVEDMRKVVDDLNKQKKELETKAAAEEGDGAKAPAAGGASSLLAGAAAIVGKGVEAVTDVGKAGAAKALGALADGLEAAIKKLSEPFEKVGNSVLEAKKDQLGQVFQNKVGNAALMKTLGGEVVTIVRGAAPYGETEYNAVPKDAITKKLLEKCEGNLKTALRDECKEAISKHTVTTTWQTLIEKYNGIGAAIKANSFLSDTIKLELKPVTLDINEHIVSEIVSEIGRLMAVEEEELRAKSEGVSTNYQDTFPIVFSSTQLQNSHYNKIFPPA